MPLSPSLSIAPPYKRLSCIYDSLASFHFRILHFLFYCKLPLKLGRKKTWFAAPKDPQTNKSQKSCYQLNKMLLRSSSTPVLGSLLSSCSDSPNTNSIHHETNTPNRHHHHPPSAIYQNHHKPSSFSLNIPTFSCNSSPISPSIAYSRNSMRRAQSEGNLEGLAYASCDNKVEQLHDINQPNKLTARNKRLMLQTIPSFSFYGSGNKREDEEDEEFDAEEAEENGEFLEKNVSTSDRVMAMHGAGSTLENMIANLSELKVKDGMWHAGFGEETNQEMFLARGIGIAGMSGGGGGGEPNPAVSGGDGEDNRNAEEYYKSMVEENPGNPLFLRNYAHFLHQSKRDLEGAEEYYSRAILADPKDGEILSQYAKLVWELHHDQDRTAGYFERAVQASPADSHVHAAYANFLWETEEVDDECNLPTDLDAMPSQFHGVVASANA